MNDFEQNKDEKIICDDTRGEYCGDVLTDTDSNDCGEKPYGGYGGNLNNNEEKVAYRYARKFNREPLILALLGMAFSFLYGVGIIFAAIALFMACRRYSLKPSQPLKWAITVSIVCIALCALYMAGLVWAVLVAIGQMQPPTEEVFNILKGFIV